MDNIRRHSVAQRNLSSRVKNSRDVYSTGTVELTQDDLYLECGENIAENDPVYTLNGLAYKADISPCIAIARTSGSTGDTIVCQYKGRFLFTGTADLDLWNLDGTLSNTPPTISNLFYQRLGTMLNSGVCLLNIESGAWNV